MSLDQTFTVIFWRWGRKETGDDDYSNNDVDDDDGLFLWYCWPAKGI